MNLNRSRLVWVIFLSVFACAQEIESVDSKQAFELTKSPSAYLIDVRSVAEYVWVGHPPTAYNVPLSFWDEKQQKLVPNENFIPDLKSRFKAEDRLIFICRSGGRSLRAARAALAAGFQKVINLSEGFEGQNDDKGYRTKDGWKNSGLPYTYELDPKLTYQPAGQSPGK